MTSVLSIDPRTGEPTGVVGEETAPARLDAIVAAAAIAAGALEDLGPRGRAQMLRAMSAALETDRAAIVAVADRETALGPTRLNGELTRTTYQLHVFADMLEEGSYLEVVIDHAGDTPMGPRPDLRRMLVPLGPVAVFGAGNFPLAFGAPGGDTAAALAAGCPVVLKAHPSHPATYARITAALAAAAVGAGAPVGTIDVVYGQEAGGALVRHPQITAVGFTGSLRGGRALYDLAAGRPEPIPFFGELGSVNPVVVTAAAIAARGPEIGVGAVASFTLGNGQFCTKPGLIFVPAVGAEPLVQAMVDAVSAGAAAPLLDVRVRDAFVSGTGRLRAHPAVEVMAEPTVDAAPSGGFEARPLLLGVAATELDGELMEECFGPTTLLVRYGEEDELVAALRRLPASLTATIHAEAVDAEGLAPVLDVLRHKVGRLLWNGFPTGVAVAWAQQHGGPYPASTSQHSSVGVTSVRRFLRPIAYQSAPANELPPALHEDNPWGIPRRVDGLLQS